MQKLTLGKSHSRHLGVDGVEDSLIANLRFGDQTDLGAKVGNTTTATRHLSPVKHSGQNEKLKTFRIKSAFISQLLLCLTVFAHLWWETPEFFNTNMEDSFLWFNKLTGSLYALPGLTVNCQKFNQKLKLLMRISPYIQLQNHPPLLLANPSLVEYSASNCWELLPAEL